MAGHQPTGDEPGRMIRSADISGDGRYRYRLGRQWGAGAQRLAWVMLNPSTADGHVDDPTITRVIGFSRAWGYDACDVVNLFALRSADPGALRQDPDPFGRRNRAAIAAALAGSAASGAAEVVVAWGAHIDLIASRGDRLGRGVRDVLHHLEAHWTAARLLPMHLGRTASGAPRHPLYLPAVTRRETFPTGPFARSAPVPRGRSITERPRTIPAHARAGRR